MNIRIQNAIYAAVALLLGGCVAGGASFEKPAPAPENAALAYFYRPVEAQGSARTLHILDRGKDITTLLTGQFSAVSIDPGHYEFSTDVTDKPESLDAKAGETYYFRFAIQHGFFLNTMNFARVYPDEAIAEMKACCKDGH